jgi:aspartate aminotransferase
VDYNGKNAIENLQKDKPKTSSERLEFVKQNAPRIVNGLDMIERFLKDLTKKSVQKFDKKSNIAESS